jgi:putative FmdB family regulatory protein
MPIYEYQCEKGHTFEVTQSIHEEPLKNCTKPRCKAGCRRLISPVAFHLSGTGWAKDGYSSAGEKKKK